MCAGRIGLRYPMNQHIDEHEAKPVKLTTCAVMNNCCVRRTRNIALFFDIYGYIYDTNTTILDTMVPLSTTLIKKAAAVVFTDNPVRAIAYILLLYTDEEATGSFTSPCFFGSSAEEQAGRISYPPGDIFSIVCQAPLASATTIRVRIFASREGPFLPYRRQIRT